MASNLPDAENMTAAQILAYNQAAVARATGQVEAQQAAARAPLAQAATQAAALAHQIAVGTLRYVGAGRVWVRQAELGTVLKLDPPTKTCTVTLQTDAVVAPVAPLHVSYGSGNPTVGKSYPVFVPYTLSREPTIERGPVPDVSHLPWLLAPGGKWLYYASGQRSGRGINVNRVPWPPNASDLVQVLYDPTTKGVPAGFNGTDDVGDLIGVDGLGQVWMRYEHGRDWAASAVGAGGTGDAVGVTLVPDQRKPVAVDATPGQSNLLAQLVVQENRHWTYIVDYIPGDTLVTFLHLQSDSGTTFGPGNVTYADVEAGIFRGGGSFIPGYPGPSITTPHGESLTGPAHYIPPNDGTSAAPHYHWYLVTDQPLQPEFTQARTDTVFARMELTRGTVTLDTAGHVAVSWAHAEDITITTSPIMDIYGIYGSGGFLGRPGEFSNNAAMQAWMLSGGADADRPKAPYAVIQEAVNYAVQAQPETGYRPHIWTAQGDEYGGNGAFVIAYPAVQYPDPMQWLGPLQAHSHALDIPATPPNNNWLTDGVPLSQHGKYGSQVWSVGPTPDGHINWAASWDNTTTFFGGAQANQQHFAAPGGVAGSIAAFPFLQMFADGRDGLDLLARDTGGHYWVSLDGGATWIAAPWPSPPCAAGFQVYGLGYIVDAA